MMVRLIDGAPRVMRDPLGPLGLAAPLGAEAVRQALGDRRREQLHRHLHQHLVCQYHITRPLALPYSLHTVLLEVESYNGGSHLARPQARPRRLARQHLHHHAAPAPEVGLDRRPAAEVVGLVLLRRHIHRRARAPRQALGEGEGKGEVGVII